MSAWQPLRVVLWPLSVLYGAVTRLRAWLYAHHWLTQKRLKGTVISVGNLTVGGTGKTPMVIWLAEKFLAEGKRVAVLSRGYRGRGGSSDEIEVMRHRLRQRVLFGVGKDRYRQGRRLESQGVDIFLLDDGFQHLQLARDVDIVLIDVTRPLRRQSLLPAGSLREPVSAVNRANLVLFTRANHEPETISAMQHLPNFPVFPARTKLVGLRRCHGDARDALSVSETLGPFFAFCGIGNAEAFFRDLQEWRIPVTGHAQFGDHHRYSVAEILKLGKAAREAGANALLTTEKDEQNLQGNCELPVYIAVVALEVPDEDGVLDRIKKKIGAQHGAAA